MLQIFCPEDQSRCFCSVICERSTIIISQQLLQLSNFKTANSNISTVHSVNEMNETKCQKNSWCCFHKNSRGTSIASTLSRILLSCCSKTVVSFRFKVLHLATLKRSESVRLIMVIVNLLGKTADRPSILMMLKELKCWITTSIPCRPFKLELCQCLTLILHNMNNPTLQQIIHSIFLQTGLSVHLGTTHSSCRAPSELNTSSESPCILLLPRALSQTAS